MKPPDILARSDDWVAINKPSGMVIHRARGSNDRHTLVAVMRDLLGPEVFPVNRLDRQTSGVIVMAFNKDAARELSNAFAQRLVEKEYEAVVRGWPPLQPGESLLVDRPLDDKPAETLVEVMTQTELDVQLGRYEKTRMARVRLRPKSGITHQLRRHLKGMGYPIINDRRHGDTQLNPKFLAEFGVKRLLLHSRRLRFPFGGETFEVEANWNGRGLGLLRFLGLGLESELPASAREAAP